MLLLLKSGLKNTLKTWWKIRAWLMEPQVWGNWRKCRLTVRTQHMTKAIEAVTVSMKKHMMTHPTNPATHECQLKKLNVGLKKIIVHNLFWKERKNAEQVVPEVWRWCEFEREASKVGSSVWEEEEDGGDRCDGVEWTNEKHYLQPEHTTVVKAWSKKKKKSDYFWLTWTRNQEMSTATIGFPPWVVHIAGLRIFPKKLTNVNMMQLYFFTDS